MSSSLFLRIAAVVMLLFAGGHLMGAAGSWSPGGETPTLEAMRTFAFDVSGVSRTYWHFYMGFGLYIGVLQLLLSVLLWQLGGLATTEPAHARRMTVTVLIGMLAGTWILWEYIFLIPVVFSVACAACLGLALVPWSSTAR